MAASPVNNVSMSGYLIPPSNHPDRPSGNKIGVNYLEKDYPSDLPSGFSTTVRVVNVASQPQESETINEYHIDLVKSQGESMMPQSLVLKIGTNEYKDSSGGLFTGYGVSSGANPTNHIGTSAGTVDYGNSVATLTSWGTPFANNVIVKSLLTDNGSKPVPNASFRVPVSPVKSQSLQLRWLSSFDGLAHSVTANVDGDFIQDGIIGSINGKTGVVQVAFGTLLDAAANVNEPWYDPALVQGTKILRPEHAYANSIEYNAVSTRSTSLSETILGLNPVRIPEDGLVPVYSEGDVIVIINDSVVSGTYVTGQVVSTGQVNVAKMKVRDAANQPVDAVKYSVDLLLGEVTILDTTGISQPMSISTRIEDMSVISDVQVTGSMRLSQPIKHDYPIQNTLVCSALIGGDLFARNTIPFDQEVWVNIWSDSRNMNNANPPVVINETTAQMNLNLYPMVLTNASTITERWCIQFMGNSTYRLFGENVGVIVPTHDLTTDLAPVNPNTGGFYMVIPWEAFGAGWVSGNIIRFNTVGCGLPAWLLESISQGDETSSDYISCVEFRGSKANDV